MWVYTHAAGRGASCLLRWFVYSTVRCGCGKAISRVMCRMGGIWLGKFGCIERLIEWIWIAIRVMKYF